jgi:hypothetical protein
MLSQIAIDYVRQHNLRSKMIASNCRRFERVTGLTDPQKITSQAIADFRQRLSGALSSVTIEKTICDVLTVVKHSTGRTIDSGRRLQRSRPEPEPVPLDSIDAIFPISPAWLRQWIVLTYWTGLRLQDSIALQLIMDAASDVLRWRAGKTGHAHAYPVPGWIRAHLATVETPYDRPTLHFCRLLRAHIATACQTAKVQEFCPQQLRQRSITEWSRANATAGRIIHGCGLGVLIHYVDPLSVLESAAPRVRLPACFGALVDSGESLLQHYARCDEQAKSIVSLTAERLAAG